MSDKRSFHDAFAPRKPQGKTGFGLPKETPVAKGFGKPAAKTPVADAFKPAPKPVKPTPAKAQPAGDVFAKAAKPPKAEPRMQRPAAPPKAASVRHEAALKPVQPGGPKLPPLVRGAEQPAQKQPAMMRAEPAPKPRNLFGRSGSEPAPKQRGLTPPPKRGGAKIPAMAFAGAGAALPKPGGGKGYNPFDRRRFVVSPAPAVEAAPASSTPDPFFDLPPAQEPPEAPAPEPRRTPFHVVPSAAAADAVAQPKAPKAGAAARSSSLVLVSGAGAVAATAAADAPEAPPAEKPPEAPPAAAAAPAAVAAADKPRRGGGGGAGGSSGGSSSGPPRQARAVAHRGFNQDDMFGVIFGIAVIAFLLMWFMRGKSEDAIEDGTLFAAQSAPVQRLAVSPTPPVPAPLPPADPFGDKPVDLRPQGPIPEAAPAPPEVAEATPAPATPPPVTAKPAPSVAESTLPLAERKMHAWFCTASSRLTKASRTELGGELDKFAKIFEGKELVVRGYADTRGSLDYNSALGGNRATVVADFLRTKGLTVVDVQGVGELDGLDDNQNCANQRRVDVWVKGGPAETPSRACAPEPDVESLVCG